MVEESKAKKKSSPPKFKSWRKYTSFSSNIVVQKIITVNSIEIAERKYKFFKSQEIEDRIKLLTIKRCGDYFVYLVCETVESKTKSDLVKASALILALRARCSWLNILKMIFLPCFFQKQKNARAKANRELSSKRRNSKNQCKEKVKLTRFHRKVANQRNA